MTLEEAYDRLIPKEVVVVGEMAIEKRCHCPVCNEVLWVVKKSEFWHTVNATEKPRYCYQCGQRLDWDWIDRKELTSRLEKEEKMVEEANMYREEWARLKEKE